MQKQLWLVNAERIIFKLLNNTLYEGDIYWEKVENLRFVIIFD